MIKLHSEKKASWVMEKLILEAESIPLQKTKIPSITPEDVLVEVRSCGLNFYDNYIRHGLGVDVKFPCVLGLECAGIVQNIGSNVQDIKCGDHVIVHCPKGGALSDYIVIGQSNVLTVPKEIDFDEASSLTVNYLTAYFSLVEIGGLKNGSSLFIQGAAGGVGWAATQIAKLYENVIVFGVASEYKHSEIKSNGVDYAFTYEQDIKSEIKRICPEGISIVLQSMVGESFHKNQELLAPLGKIILIGAKNMVDGESRNLCNILSAWWNTKNISPYSLIMENRAVAGVLI
ncbi:Synaptic vesicle membrane protein VAT-1-like protein [Armadillidium nasatum]|uniref:Synaptic vesicle membrane protein VAT-1-like protein n=1 Tax=Armadillidium nasatum TaxID=96803 RepID=A0A5N5TMN7_9CRUS|nr:Synaptic vesicle membrane protein VAT-1-like protein [Armadillidium nasatum]